MPRLGVRGLASVAVLTLAACGGAGSSPASSPAPRVARPEEGSLEATTFAPDLAVDLKAFTRLPSGMYIFDAIKGDGVVAAEGRKVTFRYSAYLPDGSLVDSQRQPIEAEMNDGMIKGLRFGMAGMRAGGQRRLVVPPSLAYGRSQVGKVPPNSPLVFDVELISVR
jgi:FKBP-type peptidyl-prolyl cis-trans isomerase